ncbi:conserved hypothetical protein [Agrobacterium tumefaciens str. CFBP 5621]|nr:conserved hypothetical protein [Agrobacterium tumefaciens str. CFBP 5621]
MDLDFDVALATLKQFGFDEIGNDGRIVQRAAIRTVFLDVEAFEEFQHFRHGDGRPCANLANAADPGLGRQQLMGDVERHHDNRHAGSEDDVGGLWVDIDVEFRRRCDVAALEEAAAHHHQFLDAVGDLRRLQERQRHIGQRAERAERYGAGGFPHQCFDDEIDRVLLLRLHGRFVENRAIEAGAAVNMFGGDGLAHQRLLGALIDWNIGAPAQFADDADVAARQLQRNVAGDGAQSENVDFLRACESEHDCRCVVLAGIGVDDDFSAFCHVLPAVEMSAFFERRVLTCQVSFLRLAFAPRFVLRIVVRLPILLGPVRLTGKVAGSGTAKRRLVARTEET